ncbi:MAG: hypothetical protein AAB553_05950 [Patescibacteria group bacterium]
MIIAAILVVSTISAVFLSQQQTQLNSRANTPIPAYCENITKNVGVPSGTTLASMAATTVRADNTIIEGQDITGDVVVYANNFTIKNSRITDGSLILRNNSDIVIENSRIGGISVSGAKNVTIRHSDIGGNVNGRGIYIAIGSNDQRPQNILVEDSWVHGQNIASIDGQKGGSYYSVHVRGVENLTLKNNYFDATPFIQLPEGGGTVAAIALQNANGGNDNVTIEGNCVDGGGFMFYLEANNLTVTNNKIGRPHYTLLYPKFTEFSQSGNTWMKSGNPVEIKNGIKEEELTPTPTATPEPTATPTQTIDPKPGDHNTGVISGTTLTAMNGGSIRTSDVTIENKEINGDIKFYANNITIKNSKINGSLGFYGSSNVTVENVDTKGLLINGTKNVTVRKTNMHGGKDCIQSAPVYRTTVVARDTLIENSWCHDVRMNPGDGSHLDGMQFRGSENLALRGNNIDVPFVDYAGSGGWNVAIFLEGANGGNNNAVIENNWINGGNRIFHLSGTNIKVINNKLGSDTLYGLLYPRSSTFYESGNVCANDGDPVNIQGGGRCD